MKTLVQKSNSQTPSFFNKFANAQLSKTAQKMIKGGDTDSTEVLIIEDLIQG